MTPRCIALAIAAAIGLHATPGYAAALEIKLATAAPSATSTETGRDLAALVAPHASIELDVVPSAGLADNVRRLRHEPGVRLAIVQSDVYQAWLDQAARGDAEAAALVRPLRVVMPLYPEEIHFVVRADSDLEFIDEIKSARINIGEPGSGGALTTTTLYRLMFNTPLPRENTSQLSGEEALVKLVTDRTVDVVAVVAGQPAKLFAEMKPEARQFIKLLKFSDRHPSSGRMLRTYAPATLRARSYPNLLSSDLPGLAVKAVLLTYDDDSKPARDGLVRFARSLCSNLAVLQRNGHRKWREVEVMLPDLGNGWIYYPPTAKELYGCIAERVSGKIAPP